MYWMWLFVCFWFWLIGIVGIVGVWNCRTESGTFKDGDLLVNRDGVRVVSQSEVEAVSVTYFSLLLFFNPFSYVLIFAPVFVCVCVCVSFNIYSIGLFNCFFSSSVAFHLLDLMNWLLWCEGIPDISVGSLFLDFQMEHNFLAFATVLKWTRYC